MCSLVLSWARANAQTLSDGDNTSVSWAQKYNPAILASQSESMGRTIA